MLFSPGVGVDLLPLFHEFLEVSLPSVFLEDKNCLERSGLRMGIFRRHSTKNNFGQLYHLSEEGECSAGKSLRKWH